MTKILFILDFCRAKNSAKEKSKSVATWLAPASIQKSKEWSISSEMTYQPAKRKSLLIYEHTNISIYIYYIDINVCLYIDILLLYYYLVPSVLRGPHKRTKKGKEKEL